MLDLITLAHPSPQGSPSGKIAGTVSRGRRQIQIDGKIYFASHLVWFGKTGKWPKGELGYRNGDRLDLRFENLFEVTMGELGRELINPPLDGCRETALMPEPAIAS